ncbi:hypothetical protein BCR44DRAFT_25901 [Catenaria anguillulae PL171]|uniref:Uncharacterized protein n=1 Tax=Catenaria anguillulae PL171 TaxID=765915 RepID=A0A1Y2HVQ6_9FUNG|nr:hypothetical protein BCR44DRAFT_25901 [Catenaria anguillulae PL171]
MDYPTRDAFERVTLTVADSMARAESSNAGFGADIFQIREMLRVALGSKRQIPDVGVILVTSMTIDTSRVLCQAMRPRQFRLAPLLQSDPTWVQFRATLPSRIKGVRCILFALNAFDLVPGRAGNQKADSVVKRLTHIAKELAADMERDLIDAFVHQGYRNKLHVAMTRFVPEIGGFPQLPAGALAINTSRPAQPLIQSSTHGMLFLVQSPQSSSIAGHASSPSTAPAPSTLSSDHAPSSSPQHATPRAAGFPNHHGFLIPRTAPLSSARPPPPPPTHSTPSQAASFRSAARAAKKAAPARQPLSQASRPPPTTAVPASRAQPVDVRAGVVLVTWLHRFPFKSIQQLVAFYLSMLLYWVSHLDNLDLCTSWSSIDFSLCLHCASSRPPESLHHLMLAGHEATRMPAA